MIRFRWYYDKDKETEWLNEMASKGYAMEKFFLGFYTFAESEPGEYLYQADLLDSWAGNKKEFAEFMEESGVEVVTQWYRWVILRRKASEGPFEMYSDIETQIGQYQKIRQFFTVALVIEIICFFMEIVAVQESGVLIYKVFAVLLALVVLAFLRMIWRCNWKIEELRRKIK